MGLACCDARSITLPMKKLQVIHDHLVSEGGLEPPCPFGALAPQASASAYSATRTQSWLRAGRPNSPSQPHHDSKPARLRATHAHRPSTIRPNPRPAQPDPGPEPDQPRPGTNRTPMALWPNDDDHSPAGGRRPGERPDQDRQHERRATTRARASAPPPSTSPASWPRSASSQRCSSPARTAPASSPGSKARTRPGPAC